MSITIKRVFQSFNGSTDFKVFLDDALVINLHNGESVTLDIDEGTHKIFLEVEERISKKIKFEMTRYEDLNFECAFKVPKKLLISAITSMMNKDWRNPKGGPIYIKLLEEGAIYDNNND